MVTATASLTPEPDGARLIARCGPSLRVTLYWHSSIFSCDSGDISSGLEFAALCHLTKWCDVRYGSLADMAGRICDVRFTPKSGHQLSARRCPLCAKSRHPCPKRKGTGTMAGPPNRPH